MTKVDQIIRLMGELERGDVGALGHVPTGRTVLKSDRPMPGTVGHMFADDEEDGLADEPEVSIPTGEPSATWLPPDRTQGHIRGYIPNPRSNRSVSYSSSLERICAYSLIANACIEDVEDQPACVYYTNANDERKSHRIDFRCETGHNKRKIAIAVRPSHMLDKQSLRDTISRINAGFLDGFADEAIILTERELTFAHGWNAKSTLRALRGRNEEHCQSLTDRLKMFNGWFEVRDLIESLPHAFGWNAVWCLIYDGLLKPFSNNVLLPNEPYVRVNREKLAQVR